MLSVMGATLACIATGLWYGIWTLVMLGFAQGLSAQLAKLCFDALVQRDVPERVRTSVFAWSETMLQMLWVLGGAPRHRAAARAAHRLLGVRGRARLDDRHGGAAASSGGARRRAGVGADPVGGRGAPSRDRVALRPRRDSRGWPLGRGAGARQNAVMTSAALQPLAVPTGDDVLSLLPRLEAALEGGAPVLPYAAGSPVPLIGRHDPADLPEGLAIAVGTSGSTGRPKRALLTAEALARSAWATHQVLGGSGAWLLAMPAHHIAGLQVLLRSIAAGTRPVVLDLRDGFTATGFVEATGRLQPSGSARRRYTALVPTQLGPPARRRRRARGAARLSTACSSAAPPRRPPWSSGPARRASPSASPTA